MYTKIYCFFINVKYYKKPQNMTFRDCV
uniref:Uncharacterized protein n=1 Tax=Anguilla anguilla TaxID=7936 RepID=A0A0E9SDX5_ANGAN